LRRVLVDAHNQAVTAALAYLDDSAVFVRRGHDGTTVEAGEGLIAAAYLHRMSRSLDPQLRGLVAIRPVLVALDRAAAPLPGGGRLGVVEAGTLEVGEAG
jgi:hypothetical protein